MYQDRATRHRTRRRLRALATTITAVGLLATGTAAYQAAPRSERPPATARSAHAPAAVSAASAASPTGAAGAGTSAGGGSIVSFVGHGWGHGRGLGQWGALGYALNSAWSYSQILDHYYGGTTVGHADPSTEMTVDMDARDGLDTVVVQERGKLVTVPPLPLSCTTGAPCAVRVVRTSSGIFQVFAGTACSGGPGGWKPVAASVASPQVIISTSAGLTEDRQDMLQLCDAAATRWLRGSLWAVDTGTSQATVNHVPLDLYLRGVVPRESPAYWGNLGSGAGEAALQAQAVAARSYALAENRHTYARTCASTWCQVYGGRAVVTSDGSFSDLEGVPITANSDRAVTSTAGEIRLLGGVVARTEFSSSTGGWTAGGTFPSVVDNGDSVSGNPNHAWTTEVAASNVETAFSAGRGQLVSMSVSQRNGQGDLGGRAQKVLLRFQTGDVIASGAEVVFALGLKSDWFEIQGISAPAAPGGPGGSGPVPPPAPPPPRRLAYYAATADGSVYASGGAPFVGSLRSRGIKGTAVGLAQVTGGYWVLTADGNVYPFGSVASYGSLAGLALNGPPRQIAATPSGKGYWIMAEDGGVFSFGDARFYGSTGNIRLNAPVVGMAPTLTGNGYWLLGGDGGVFSFGDAHFYGSTGNIRLNAPVNAMAAVPDGSGYWLAASDGGVFSFGSAHFAGSLPGIRVSAVAAAMQPSPTGGGYLIATASGKVFGFGDVIATGGPADVGASTDTIGVALAR